MAISGVEYEIDLSARHRKRWNYRRLARLVITFTIISGFLTYLIQLITFPSDALSFLVGTLSLIVARVLVTATYKMYSGVKRRNAYRIDIIKKIGSDAEFARVTIDALRLGSSANRQHLTPAVAASIEDDSFMKETWCDAHRELQRLYSVLGSPPMRTLTGARNE
jgi:hypothetical protein